MSTGVHLKRAVAAEVIALAATVAAMLALASSAAAGTLWVKTCGSFGVGALRVGSPPAGIAVTGTCPGGPIVIKSRGTAVAGARETVQATAPPGVSIVHFWIDNYSLAVFGVNDGTGFGGGFYDSPVGSVGCFSVLVVVGSALRG